MKKKYNISYGSVCDIGDKKPTNQDCVFSKHAMVNDKALGLFIVADGVGGLSNGDVISNIIVLHFEKWFNRIIDGEISPENYISELDRAINIVNKMAYDYSESISEKMGSTLALLFTVDDTYHIRNVGDSRIYYVDRQSKLRQLSYDHSYVAELVRNGEITEREARVHPKKNVLLSCIGVKPEITFYSSKGSIEKENAFIVCSDGFYNYASADKLSDVLKNKKIDEQKRAEQLRECISVGNAKDNVSIIAVKIAVKRKIF